ncbi:hypothetical protein HZZ00_34920 [Streptomyces sp. NEAU-sy36]|uniref:hypothetical protein n=1 Tax=unclassified Streptomyces TaxID=2593676 RepID=UPI0015D6557D|nr:MULTISPECIES: hypothetical protein [unclassified Streptomyces]QLJ05705.1 hypothetical protein HZZ00_34920 [Streptomyces sp. NEAU-sy36]
MLTRVTGSVGVELAHRIPDVLRAALGRRWEFTVDGPRIEILHPHRGTPYRPPRRPPTWRELLDSLELGFARDGAPRDACLPLRWGRETELTISAVQALDPLLKDGQPRTHRSGFIPQPVVRFTGHRDAAGELRDGFLTSFVNISRVQPIQSMDEYGAIFDGWLNILSQLGFHARHLSIYGALAPWRRRQVEGITLRFRHLDLTLGDIVLLWNTAHPHRLAVDLGTGLERLAWARTREGWPSLIYGHFARVAPPLTLDAIRTATLLLGSGIAPAARGAGGITRRVISAIDPDVARLGVSAMVRAVYDYWSLFGTLLAPWPEIARVVEEEAMPGPVLAASRIE